MKCFHPIFFLIVGWAATQTKAQGYAQLQSSRSHGEPTQDRSGEDTEPTVNPRTRNNGPGSGRDYGEPTPMPDRSGEDTEPTANPRTRHRGPVGSGTSSDWHYCSDLSFCLAGYGDCDFDSQCSRDLVCGINNCRDFHANAQPAADCCTAFTYKTYGHWFKWNDKGSGGRYDFSCWNPKYTMFGSIPVRGYSNPGDKSYIWSYPSSYFKRPTGYSKIWADHGSGANRDVSFWQPICPPGYSALGDYCKNGYSKPSTSEMKCARTDLTKPCSTSWVWNDKGSGSHKDATVFKTADGYMRAFGDYRSSSSARCLNTDL